MLWGSEKGSVGVLIVFTKMIFAIERHYIWHHANLLSSNAEC